MIYDTAQTLKASLHLRYLNITVFYKTSDLTSASCLRPPEGSLGWASSRLLIPNSDSSCFVGVRRPICGDDDHGHDGQLASHRGCRDCHTSLAFLSQKEADEFCGDGLQAGPVLSLAQRPYQLSTLALPSN